MSHTEWGRALSPLAPASLARGPVVNPNIDFEFCPLAPASLARGRKRLEAPDLMLWSLPDSSGRK
jgi:hypothetical protein